MYPDVVIFLQALNNGLVFKRKYNIAISLPIPSGSNSEGEVSALELLFINRLEQTGQLNEIKAIREADCRMWQYVNILETPQLNEQFQIFQQELNIDDIYNTDLDSVYNGHLASLEGY